MPPKDVFKTHSPVPVNVTLSGNRIFINVIQLRCGYTEIGWALNVMTGISVREKRGRFGYRDTEETRRKESQVMAKAEIGVMMPLQAKEYQRLLANHQKPGEKHRLGSP